MQEQWRMVYGLEDWYEVSSSGRVRRLKAACGTHTGKIITPVLSTLGYLEVRFSIRGRQVRKGLHLVVMEAFNGPRPPDHETNHKDGNKLNCHLDNLEWCTRGDNIRHSFRTGLRKANRKLTPDQAVEVRTLRGVTPQRVLAKRYGISASKICEIQTGQAYQF